MSSAFTQCMKTLIILMASILVTTTSAFAQKDINDTPITCKPEEADAILVAAVDRYDMQTDGDLIPVIQLGRALKKELQTVLNDNAEAAKTSPDDMALLLTEAACIIVKIPVEKRSAELKAGAKVHSDSVSKISNEMLSNIPENPEGDQIFEQAAYKMLRANSTTVGYVIEIFK